MLTIRKEEVERLRTQRRAQEAWRDAVSSSAIFHDGFKNITRPLPLIGGVK